jgi:hypothetical protein
MLSILCADLAKLARAAEPKPHRQRPTSPGAPELPPKPWKSKCYTKARPSMKNVWNFGFYPRTYRSSAARTATPDKQGKGRGFTVSGRRAAFLRRKCQCPL